MLASGIAFAAEPAELVKTACTTCHNLDVVTQKLVSKDEWRDVVNAMVKKGAALKPDEASAVTDYLATKYTRLTPEKEARAKALVESVCILCHEFARISTEALTRDQWAGEIRGMLAEGAPLTDEEFDIVVDYLTKTYGVKQQ